MSQFNSRRSWTRGLAVAALTALASTASAGNPWDPLGGSLPQLKLPESSRLVAPPQVSVTPYFAPQAAAAAPAPRAQVAAAATITQYQVEYRHPTETANQWRVAAAWTSDYTYALGVYDRMVSYRTYDVRFYKRNR